MVSKKNQIVKKTIWLLNILAIAKRTPHPPISDDVLIEGGIFPTHFFGQKHSIFVQNLAPNVDAY